MGGREDRSPVFMEEVPIPSAPWLRRSRRGGASIPGSLTSANWLRALSIDMSTTFSDEGHFEWT